MNDILINTEKVHPFSTHPQSYSQAIDLSSSLGHLLYKEDSRAYIAKPRTKLDGNGCIHKIVVLLQKYGILLIIVFAAKLQIISELNNRTTGTFFFKVEFNWLLKSIAVEIEPRTYSKICMQHHVS